MKVDASNFPVTYDPANLLDYLVNRLHLRNDAALSRKLEIAPAVLSKIRHARTAVSASVLIQMHTVTGISILDLRKLMGDRRIKFRPVSIKWTDEQRQQYLKERDSAADLG